MIEIRRQSTLMKALRYEVWDQSCSSMHYTKKRLPGRIVSPVREGMSSIVAAIVRDGIREHLYRNLDGRGPHLDGRA